MNDDNDVAAAVANMKEVDVDDEMVEDEDFSQSSSSHHSNLMKRIMINNNSNVIKTGAGGNYFINLF